MDTKPRARFWVATGLALAGLVAAVLTLVWKDWIEIVFRFDPDRHDGSLEWLIALGFVLVSAVLAAAARFEWRRAAAVPS